MQSMPGDHGTGVQTDWCGVWCALHFFVSTVTKTFIYTLRPCEAISSFRHAILTVVHSKSFYRRGILGS